MQFNCNLLKTLSFSKHARTTRALFNRQGYCMERSNYKSGVQGMTNDTPQKQRFSADRFCFIREPRRDLEGWYYHAREGIFGPFKTKQHAEEDLERLKVVNPTTRRELFRRLGLHINHFNE